MESAMRRNVLVLMAVLAAAIVVLTRPASPGFYLGGIQVNEPDHAHWLDRLEDSRMNTVSLTVYAKQGDWDSANLWWEDDEPWVVAEMESARKAGLETVLILRVALDHAFERNKFFWHGMILPESDEDLEEWFRRYRQFALKWAATAERQSVDVLAIGSEMNTLTSTIQIDELPGLEEYWTNVEKVARENDKVLRHGEGIEQRHLSVRGFDDSAALDAHLDERSAAHAEWARQVTFLDYDDYLERINARRRRIEGFWRDLISELRGVFSGKLTYAANFDQYEMVTLWDDLDYIAINAYFPLRKLWQPGTTAADLYPVFEVRWAAILRSIRQLALASGWGEKPVLFTELGYVYRKDSTIEPWNATGFSVLPSVSGEKLMVWEDQPIDLDERAMALRALYVANQQVEGHPLEGILYWKLSTQSHHFDDEPFVLIIHEDAYDPLLEELQRFRRWHPIHQARHRLGLE